MSETTTKATGKTKNLNVQVPGETTTKATADEQSMGEVAAKPKDSQDAPRTARHYRDLHAHEIDPATLAAPVLTRDGYLCPSK